MAKRGARASRGSRFLPTRHSPPPGWKSPLASQQPLTTTRWLTAAVAATLLVAGFCVYVTFCLLFWQGQWQLVFKPPHAINSTPASAGLPYNDIQFDATETGVLQLHGWWVAAGNDSAGTVLVMHDGSGSLSTSLPLLQELHALGLNVFAFDYRGFGQSVQLHPSEASTSQDAEAAWEYLTATRRLRGSRVALYGVGLGAALAAEAARRHPECAALVLEQPVAPVLETLQSDPKIRWLPVRWLFHDRFNPAAALGAVTRPKLFLYKQGEPARYYALAAEPKEKAESSDQNALAGFLRKYLPQS